MYSKIWNNSIFYTNVKQEFDNIIYKLIKEISGLTDYETNSIKWTIVTDDYTSKALLLENKFDSFVDTFDKIINAIKLSKDENIVNVLNDKNLFEKYEDLYYFFEENKWEIFKKTIYYLTKPNVKKS